jgi:glycine cleavage system H protein
MNVPSDRKFTKDHEWAVLDGSTLRIGITDYAQDALGDVVFVGLPTVGLEVTGGSAFAEVESTKSVSDIYAPLGGTVARVNDELADHPELLNEDPYGEGWLCEITVTDPASYEGLLSAGDYESLITGS